MSRTATLGLIFVISFATACIFQKDDTDGVEPIPGIYEVTSTLTSSTGDCSGSNTPSESNIKVEIALENGTYTLYGLDDQNTRKATIATSKNGSVFENSGPVMQIGNCVFYQALVIGLSYQSDDVGVVTISGTSSVSMTTSCTPGECKEYSDIKGTKA